MRRALETLQKGLKMQDGFFEIRFNRAEIFDPKQKVSMIHITVAQVLTTRPLSLEEVKAAIESVRPHIESLSVNPGDRKAYGDNTVYIHLSDVVTPQDIQVIENDKIAQRIEHFGSRTKPVPPERIWARVKQVARTTSMPVVSNAPGRRRKTQNEITAQRTPERAQRLRILKSLLTHLTDLAKTDPALGGSERLQVLAVANALSIRGTQALQNSTAKLFSARTEAMDKERALFKLLLPGETIDSPRGDAVRNNNRDVLNQIDAATKMYFDEMLRFDRALMQTVHAVAEDQSDRTWSKSVDRATDSLSLLANASFNIDRLDTTDENKAECGRVISELRAQLKTFALSQESGANIPRGTNMFKTMNDLLGFRSLSNKLVEKCRAAAEKGEQFTPDIVDRVDDEVSHLPSPDTVRTIESLERRLLDFKTTANRLTSDMQGLRAALRLGQWEDTGPWNARQGTRATTLIDAVTETVTSLSSLRNEVESWRDENKLPERGNDNSSDPDSTAFRIFERDVAGVINETTETLSDAVSLFETINNDDRMKDIEKLGKISNILRTHVNLHDGDDNPEDISEMAGSLLFAIGSAIDKENWAKVSQLARNLPGVLKGPFKLTE